VDLGRETQERDGRERRRHEPGKDVGHDHDPAAIEAVRHHAAKDREEEDRQEPDEVEDPDRQRGSGQLVDEDRTGDRLQPGPDIREEAARPVDGEGPVPERSEAAAETVRTMASSMA